MKRNYLTGPDERIENANGIIFKEQRVVSRGGRQGVKLLGPIICVEHGPDYSVTIEPPNPSGLAFPLRTKSCQALPGKVVYPWCATVNF